MEQSKHPTICGLTNGGCPVGTTEQPHGGCRQVWWAGAVLRGPRADLRMRPWNTEYRVSSGGMEYFPFTMRSRAPSSNGCCRKHSRYRMQPRAWGAEVSGVGGTGQGRVGQGHGLRGA